MSAGTVLEPPPMYRVRPYFQIKKVRLPNCMYLLKPLHQLTAIKTGPDETVGPALSYLEHRQEWVLSQISQLQLRVKGLGEALGVSPESVGVLPQTATTPQIPPDIVISSPPSSPPYLLLPLCHCIAHHTPISCHVHSHSSLLEPVPDQLREFWKTVPQSPNPKARITLLWKSASTCAGPTMVVSPHNQTPIEGVANIARYLCRELCPELYEGKGEPQALKVDSWLDAISGTYIHGSSKEKLSVVRRLNSHFGSNQFLVGTDITLADIVAYSVLCGSPGGQKLTGNIKTWIKRCQSLPQFQGIPTPQFNENTFNA